MNDLFSRKWILATIVAWLFILLLDEASYYIWKQLNPGSSYSGIVVKHPPSADQAGSGSKIANGYRPGNVYPGG